MSFSVTALFTVQMVTAGKFIWDTGRLVVAMDVSTGLLSHFCQILLIMYMPPEMPKRHTAIQNILKKEDICPKRILVQRQAGKTYLQTRYTYRSIMWRPSSMMYRNPCKVVCWQYSLKWKLHAESFTQ